MKKHVKALLFLEKKQKSMGDRWEGEGNYQSGQDVHVVL